MRSVQRPKGIRKSSTVGAVGVAPHGTPGDEHGSPHGSNGRTWIDGRGVKMTSWLTVQTGGRSEAGHRYWQVVRVDRTGGLGLEETTVLVDCLESALEASEELAAWSHALDLPYRDYGAPGSETRDPVAGWPVR